MAQGWSAVTCQDIAEGCFVAQYAGELVSNTEADNRLQAYDSDVQAIGHALLVKSLLPIHAATPRSSTAPSVVHLAVCSLTTSNMLFKPLPFLHLASV